MDQIFGNHKRAIKLVLLGDGHVGKSSLFERLTSGSSDDYSFNKKYDATTGCNVSILKCKENKLDFEIHLFDTAGQEKFGELRESYILGADGVIIMYDVSEPQTKENIYKWINNVKILNNKFSSKNIPIVICGNKIDVKKLGPRESYIFRDSALSSLYDGFITSCYISVKANKDIWNPLNILVKQIYNYWKMPQIKTVACVK